MAKTIYKNATYAHSFWRGCQPVSEDVRAAMPEDWCAEMVRFSRQLGATVHGRTLFTWQRKAAMEGKVETVFTCALSDFFHPDADAWRREAWAVIKKCPNLILADF